MCMKEVNLKVKLVSSEDNVDTIIKGNIIKNQITYKENDINVVIIINKDSIVMERKSKDYHIFLNFDKSKPTISTYQVFGGLKTFDLETITKKFNITTKRIEIDYILEGNTFSYTLEMEDL